MNREGYSLWFNRDELHSRSPEVAPQEFDTAQGGVWLAPLDPDSRGTWLMTNLGISLSGGIVGAIINAMIGAIVILVLIGLVRRG